MEARRRKLVFVTVAFALTPLLSVPLPGSPQDSTASGTLTLNGTSTSLRYSYAAAQPGFFDKAAEDIRVLLSDVPLTEEARRDVFELIHLARAGKAHIVEVVLDASATPISGAIYAPAFDGMVSLAGIHRFERRRFEHQVVEGRLSTREPSEFVNVRFQYEADFSAVIPRPPTPKEVAAELASPPAQVATAYVKAIREGALPAFLGTLAASAIGDYRGPDAVSRFARLRAETPPDTRVTNVTDRLARSATVTIEGHENGIVIEYSLKLVVENGAWKVSK